MQICMQTNNAIPVGFFFFTCMDMQQEGNSTYLAFIMCLLPGEGVGG